jgi:hypothetical protein
MADTKQIEIEIVADAKKFRNEIKNAVKDTKNLNNMSDRMRKSGIKGHKDLTKVTQQLGKINKTDAGLALKTEKKLEAAIKQTTRTMRDKLKVAGGNRAAIDNEVRSLKKLETAHRRLQQQRHAAGRLTMGERFRGAMGGMGMRRPTGGGLAGASNFLMGGALGAGAMLGGAALGLLTSQLSSGYGAKVQYGQTAGELTGSGGRRSQLERARRPGVAMGFGPIETAAQARGVARATGRIGAVTQAQAAARTTMQDVSETTGFMGTLTRAGRGFGGKAGGGGRKDMQQIIAAGMASGLDRSRVGEYMHSIGSLIETQAGRTAGDVDPTEINKFMLAMGRSGLSGLQGARGGAVASQLDQAIRQPGGGEAGQALMLQAFGFGKPGGTSSYYQAKKRQQQGVHGKGNVQALFDETKSQYGGGEAQIMALGEMTGLSYDTLEQLRAVNDSGKDSTEKQKEIQKILENARPVEEQALEEMKEFGHTLQRVAGLEDRSVGIGEAIEESIERMQDVLNEMISKAMPVVVAALSKIANLMELIWHFMQENWGGITGAEATTERASITKEFAALKERRAAGGSAADFEKGVAALQTRSRSVQMSLGDTGIRGIGEGVGHIFNRAANSLGFDVEDSDWMKRENEKRQGQELEAVLSQTRARSVALKGLTLTEARAALDITKSLTPEQKSQAQGGGTALIQEDMAPGGRLWSLIEPILRAQQTNSDQTNASVRNLTRDVQGSGSVQGRRPAATAADSSGTGQRAP